MKRIAILGSTGSIGCSSLKVIEAHPEAYQVTALAAGKNIDLLAEQVRKFRPLEVAVLGDEEAESLKKRLDADRERGLFPAEKDLSISPPWRRWTP